MRWTDSGTILSVQEYGENSRIVTVLTRTYGRYAGLVTGRKQLLQPGNVVHATWNARLPEHLGRWVLETEITVSARFMHHPLKLACLSTLCCVTNQALPERHPCFHVYAYVSKILSCLERNNDFLKNYALYELFLLKEMGFGLDLSCCAVTGQDYDLIYVSPKTGRAVSREAGLPYHDKLLALPSFFQDLSENPTDQDVKKALMLTGYFLNSHISSMMIRQRFVDMIIPS